uniref:Cacna2d1 n=1 Tax=Nematostella vectensis TaxID=45351 RepID=A0A6M5KB44_NEMVE|nr:cacna2d1 [Nematostella vectensis]
MPALGNVMILLAVCLLITDAKPLDKVIVESWAQKVEGYLLKLAEEGLKTKELQREYDKAVYTVENKDGLETIKSVKDLLGNYFVKKEQAAKKLAEEVAELHDKFYTNSKLQHNAKVTNLKDLGVDHYTDKDIVKTLPDLEFDTLFKMRVSKSKSAIKISDQVVRNDKNLIETVYWSSKLDEMFKKNLADDPELRWQNFGSVEGVLRQYPSSEWQTNFAGFHIDYDPRMRPWYIGATSGPKDIVIILDCSLSMKGKRLRMAKEIAKTVLNTLTKQDFVNVICGHASNWDEVGKWYQYDTEVLSCQKDRLVPASTSHRKDLTEKINNLQAGGTSELKAAFKKAFELLKGRAKTGCQSIIIFVTDGEDNDGDPVRCGQGYYTRSGYVPGQLCKYDWAKVWNEVEAINKYMNPRTRIFSYLTNDKGEEFPGKLSCDNNGYMKRLVDNENIISQMQEYYSFLASNTISINNVTWTAPYLDASGLGLMVTVAMPVTSKLTNRTIGVVGIDATLEEIENILQNDQWGSVYAFLINDEGETIFHPLLRPSTELVDDPIFIQISDLEQRDGEPKEFSKVQEAMMDGKTGSYRIENAIRSIPKGDFQDGVVLVTSPSTYFYTSIKDSVYAFAFNLADSDVDFRRPLRPKNQSDGQILYYSYLEAYNLSSVRKELGGLYDKLDVKYNLPAYPNIYISLDRPSVMLAPKTYCHPNDYLFHYNISTIAVEAHRIINGITNSTGCPNSMFNAAVRPDVMVTSKMESIWLKRNHETLKDVRWTYVGTRSGVFIALPGHRTRRNYDPTRRPWYQRTLVNPAKTAVSNAYMDDSGIGKVITISQAVFQGIPTEKPNCSGVHNLRGGCRCVSHRQCLSGKCRSYSANRTLCAGDRVEAVTALDVLYRDFHRRVYELMTAPDGERSCGANYTCPDGIHTCQTKCYLVDNLANLVTDPSFLTVSTTDEREYKRVSLGRKEGDVMKRLIQRGIFQQNLRIDFQGVCSVSPYAPKVTLEGLLKTPEQEDDYYKNKGPIPPFRNEYGCIQDVVGYSADDSALGADGIISGSVEGPCRSGNYFITALPQTNLYLLVIENWSEHRQSYFYNFNCHISNRVYDAGAFRIVNGTCAHIETKVPLNTKKKCPGLRNVKLKCSYNSGITFSIPCLQTLLFIGMILWKIEW